MEGACVEIVGDGVRGGVIVVASVPVDVATPDFVKEGYVFTEFSRKLCEAPLCIGGSPEDEEPAPLVAVSADDDKRSCRKIDSSLFVDEIIPATKHKGTNTLNNIFPLYSHFFSSLMVCSLSEKTKLRKHWMHAVSSLVDHRDPGCCVCWFCLSCYSEERCTLRFF